MDLNSEEMLKLAKDILTKEEIAKVLITPRITGLYKVMKVLENNPRLTLRQIQKKTSLPISTIHSRILAIKEHFEMKMIFVPKDT